jgi:HK97 family phage prohead protease
MTMLIRATTLDAPVVDGRTVIGLCVPFNRPTIVADEPGKFYQEQFVPGAFQRAVHVPHRVNIRLSHSADQIVRAGRAARFREESDGLYGEFVADETPIGEALLARARSGEPVGLSIGAVPLKTEKRGAVVTRTSVHLDHVAATESPAYRDARVLAVRTEVEDPRTLAYWLSKYGSLLPN